MLDVVHAGHGRRASRRAGASPSAGSARHRATSSSSSRSTGRGVRGGQAHRGEPAAASSGSRGRRSPPARAARRPRRARSSAGRRGSRARRRAPSARVSSRTYVSLPADDARDEREQADADHRRRRRYPRTCRARVPGLTSQVAERPQGAQARASRTRRRPCPSGPGSTGIVGRLGARALPGRARLPGAVRVRGRARLLGAREELRARPGISLLRDVPATLGYAKGYPVLISPGVRALRRRPPRLRRDQGRSTSLLMSTRGRPGLFHRAPASAGQRWALFAAALAVAIPPMLYTSVVMTENAFYPVFMLFVWALVAALERPTPLRQLAVFAASALAYVIRAQAVALLPATPDGDRAARAAERGRRRRRRAPGAAWRTVTVFWVSWPLVVVAASASWSSRRRGTGRCEPCSAPTSGRARRNYSLARRRALVPLPPRPSSTWPSG